VSAVHGKECVDLWFDETSPKDGDLAIPVSVPARAKLCFALAGIYSSDSMNNEMWCDYSMVLE